MKINTTELKRERQWRATTGLTKEQFYKLLEEFKKHYKAHYEYNGINLKNSQEKTGIAYCITNEEDLLLFTLFSFKANLTYDLLGLVSGMEGSNAKRNQQIGIELLTKTLASLDCLPKRNFMNIEEFEAYFKDNKTLIIDATEQAIQRPKNKEIQKDTYSGKKKETH